MVERYLTFSGHAEGTVPIKVSVNGKPAGSRQLTYYSMSVDVVAGISQIYLQQLVPLLDDVLRRKEPLCSVEDVDKILIQLFDEDGSASNAQHIPPQAFEQLFGVYSHVITGIKSNTRVYWP